MPDIMKDYIGVDERHDAFLSKYPDGRVQCSKPEVVEVGGQLFILAGATVWRSVDDPLPAIGWAWQEFPGPTNFTRKSEAMNAETSAVGRALAWVGIETKRGIASREDVRNSSGLDYDRGSHPPSSTDQSRVASAGLRDEAWRAEFISMCVEARLDVTDVCLLASDNIRSLPQQFDENEYGKLRVALNRLKADQSSLPSSDPGPSPQGGPSALGSRAKKP